LCSKTTTVLLEWTVPNTVDGSLLHFYYIKNKVYINVYILYRNVYIQHIQYTHTL